jgi:hypothetical protein
MHMLGGVQNNAPHSTQAGHCNDERDVMCYSDGGPAASMQAVCADLADLFDCRNDDYFNTHPAAGSYLDRNWNTADSSFLDDVAPPAPAPKVSVGGLSTLRAGLSRTVAAASVTPGVSYRWTARPAACLRGTRSSAKVKVVCPSHFTGTVKLTVAAATSASATATVTRAITLLRTPKADMSVSLKAPRSVPAGGTAGVTVKLSYRKAPVRGRVTLFAQSRTGEWKAVTDARDTGSDGVYTWSLHPTRTKRFALVVTHARDTGWRRPPQPTTTVRLLSS